MSLIAREFGDLDVSPIDLVEDVAELMEWDVDRLGDDSIAIAAAGAWRTYSVTLAWCEADETLRMVATFDLGCEQAHLPEFYRALEMANDAIWLGCFTFWVEQSLVAYRYGLALNGRAGVTAEQVDAMLRSAVENCERYFPAFDLVAQSGADAGEALDTALIEVAGSA